MNTVVAYPQANGLVESENKSLMEGIKARLRRDRFGWVEEFPNVLWAHRTSIKQSNGETPFSLTYESEAVIPTEIGMPTYRTMMIQEGFNKEELHLNLDLLQERREMAAIQETSELSGRSGEARAQIGSYKPWKTRRCLRPGMRLIFTNPERLAPEGDVYPKRLKSKGISQSA
ncbi:reverse transcriptase domain-containing protein [Tanacetum coccineum]|uniref:Reverse transcriptase domain-containing protein n=1 Tax=Tanacetum coccineum TaxID=301880 RepID=A0ABQ5EDR4_9ASTR